eukprot:3501860-Karenia_brevis.AAC.1
MQSVVSCAQVKHLEACNRVLHDMNNTAEEVLIFMADKFQCKTSLLITCPDASWANDTKHIGDKVFSRRSQDGRINMLGEPDWWNSDKGCSFYGMEIRID